MHCCNLVSCNLAERVRRLLRLSAELRILFRYFGVHLKRTPIPAEKIQTRKPPDARECDITLPEFKNVAQIHHRFVQTHPLALMHSDCPSKTKWQLRNLRTNFPVLFHRPVHWLNLNPSSATCLHDWITTVLIKFFNRAKRAVHESFFRIIFCEHHGRSDFEVKRLGRKASSLKCEIGRAHV